MFEHTVVGVDFSPAWPRLKARLRHLQRWGGKRVTLVHVLATRYPAAPQEGHRAHYEQRLGEEARALEAEGYQVAWQLRTGEPAGELLAAVAQTGGGVLLCGVRGHGPFQRFFMGSTALELARLTRTPLWLEPLETAGADAETGVALLATDGSEAARAAERCLAQLRPRLKRAVAASVAPPGASADARAAEAQAHLARLAQTIDGLETRLVRGDPRAAIVALLRELEADVTIIGQRGHNPLRELLLGSTAEAVCRGAGRAVLLVPSR